MNRVLIDTQALIWFAEGSAALSAKARAAIDDPSLIQLVSVASLWEMGIKTAQGKLTLTSGSLRQLPAMLKSNDIEVLPILGDEAIDVASLPRLEQHKDPFDRLIAAPMPAVRSDARVDRHGV